ncbi:MAG: HD-GYP domain-containing protein [Planctomycetes bacterium]|nr:HD-GYP domain-containing protein [Planctomycetota bacterium]
MVPEAHNVARPVSVSVIAILVASYALAGLPGQLGRVALGLAIAAISAATVLLVYRAAADLHGRSCTARRAAVEAERHYVEVLRRIVSYAESRDRYRCGHSANVGRLAGRIAERMGLPAEQCRLLRLAGELHDVGMLAVRDDVFRSSGPLGDEQLRSVRRHPEISYEVLRPLGILGGVLEAIRTHHERLNGTGYPRGLRGEKIPLGGRILAVADAYDAMTHDRPYRGALAPLSAVRELRRCCPRGFDRRCVDALAAVLHVGLLEGAVGAARPGGTAGHDRREAAPQAV